MSLFRLLMLRPLWILYDFELNAIEIDLLLRFGLEAKQHSQEGR